MEPRLEDFPARTATVFFTEEGHTYAAVSAFRFLWNRISFICRAPISEARQAGSAQAFIYHSFVYELTSGICSAQPVSVLSELF